MDQLKLKYKIKNKKYPKHRLMKYHLWFANVVMCKYYCW